MIKLCLAYDQLEWATGSECLALKKHLELNAPGEFDVHLGPAGAASVADCDLFLSGIYYALADAKHPKSISMISSESYWIRKSWTAQQNTETGIAGWPHLHEWKYMVAHNKEVFERLTSEDHPKIKLLYHVFDHDFWAPGSTTPQRTNSPFRVGYAGHTQDTKGWDIFQAAAKAMPDVEFVFSTYEHNRRPAAEMPNFYRSLNAYLCPARWDCGPRPPIEAGLCGVPVITTRIGQIQEMIVDRENGLFIEPNVESVCDAIDQLRKDTPLYSRLCQNIRPSFVDTWCLKVGRDWTNYLLDIAAGRF